MVSMAKDTKVGLPTRNALEYTSAKLENQLSAWYYPIPYHPIPHMLKCDTAMIMTMCFQMRHAVCGLMFAQNYRYPSTVSLTMPQLVTPNKNLSTLVTSTITHNGSTLDDTRHHHNQYDQLDELNVFSSYKDRRSFFTFLALTVSSLDIACPQRSTAFSIDILQQSSNHRQLELCLVNIIRTKYWAINVAKSIKYKLLDTISINANNSVEGLTETQRKQPYLEARIGAKALLTQKIGGGSNANVVKVASFKLRECLEDGKYWCNEMAKNEQNSNDLANANNYNYPKKYMKKQSRICKNELSTISEELIESLASIVEFDGLETTIDPSPRSSLMLTMYTPQKGTFVYRTLIERVIPSCDRYLHVFEERKLFCEQYIQREYSDEVPLEVLQKLFYDS